ncbi:MAG: alpha/beta hydrolase [Thermodesulfobacteriota bacterium]
MSDKEQMRQMKIEAKTGAVAGALFAPEAPGPFPCVVLCHGAFEYKENFFSFCRGLARQKLAAFAIDMPGHGESGGNRYAIDVDAWVAAIGAAIDFLIDEPVADAQRIGAFGFSSGGTAVLEAALQEPRIRAIATLDATVQNYMGPWDTFLFKILTGIGSVKKQITGSDLRLNLQSVLKNAHVAYDPAVNEAIVSDPRMLAAYAALPLPGAAACAFVDTVDRVGGITQPTLIMHGENDGIDSKETAYQLFERLDCEKSIEIIPESGHCGHLDTHHAMILDLLASWMSTHL